MIEYEVTKDRSGYTLCSSKPTLAMISANIIRFQADIYFC